jgi:hypothetical protein
MKDDNLASFKAFTEAARSRLEKGRGLYGDRSFPRKPEELLAEIEEEALDLAGWGYIAWSRVRSMREALDKLHKRTQHIKRTRLI